MVNINVPGQAASANPSTASQKLFYFGTISQKSGKSSGSGSGGRGEGGSDSPGQLNKQNSVTRLEEEVKAPIPGVRLGPLLGKGSFGSVHYGTWNGAQIAVKVRCSCSVCCAGFVRKRGRGERILTLIQGPRWGF